MVSSAAPLAPSSAATPCQFSPRQIKSIIFILIFSIKALMPTTFSFLLLFSPFFNNHFHFPICLFLIQYSTWKKKKFLHFLKQFFVFCSVLLIKTFQASCRFVKTSILCLKKEKKIEKIFRRYIFTQFWSALSIVLYSNRFTSNCLLKVYPIVRFPFSLSLFLSLSLPLSLCFSHCFFVKMG